MNIEDAVHTFVSLGNKMSDSLGDNWSPQVTQTERGWGLIACYDYNGVTQAKWSSQVLDKEDLDCLYKASAVMCNSDPDKEGFKTICTFLDQHGFVGKLPVTGDAEYYALPTEEEFLVKLEYLTVPSDNLSDSMK